VAPLWFLAQLCFNMSLSMTSVTSNTILSSPASLFTFFLSVLVIGEKFTMPKLIAVLLTVAGVRLLLVCFCAFRQHAHMCTKVSCVCAGQTHDMMEMCRAAVVAALPAHLQSYCGT
jgi:uncharacterized membrane protein